MIESSVSELFNSSAAHLSHLRDQLQFTQISDEQADDLNQVCKYTTFTAVQPITTLPSADSK